MMELEKKKAPYIPISWVLSVVATLALTIFTTKEFNAIFGIPATVIEGSIKILLVASFILLIILGIVKLVYHVKKRWSFLTVDLVKDALETYSEELNVYNVLLIIPDFSDKKLSILAKKNPQWRNAIFLPFIDCDSKEEFTNLDKDKLYKKIHELIITDVNLEFVYLPEMDIYNDIKYHKDEQHLRRYNFKFILVYPKSNFLINTFLQDTKKLGYSFFDIEEMKEDTSSMTRNAEVIDRLLSNGHSLQQKISMLNRNENRLVWNISKQCHETCEFCAFGHSTTDDSSLTINIRQLIDKLSAIKLDVIDISTGDMIDIAYLKNCITELKNEDYRIHLTATAKIIDQLDKKFISENISMIEFTYDGLGDHRSKDYNESNYSCIRKLSRDFRGKNVAFKALITLYSHISLKMFKEIISKLIKINVHDVTLIRLMPVGLMSDKPYPPKLKEKRFYDEYINFNPKGNMNIIPHCSFDGVKSKDVRYCNKGITKLSMGPSGDIYDCPWGEHLSGGHILFKLGNIIEDDISEILNKKKKKNMGSEKFSCEIFNVSMNEDFLYK
jgi:MoaA/NifB/PqqE/SkfB family radical SAM enzyme